LAGRRRGVFRALAGNAELLRVVGAYALFILTEYSAWIAILVYAYGRGGAPIAGVVALVKGTFHPNDTARPLSRRKVEVSGVSPAGSAQVGITWHRLRQPARSRFLSAR
jgi:hypothetical protein